MSKVYRFMRLDLLSDVKPYLMFTLVLPFSQATFSFQAGLGMIGMMRLHASLADIKRGLPSYSLEVARQPPLLEVRFIGGVRGGHA